MGKIQIESEVTVKVTKDEKGNYFVYELSEKRSAAGKTKWSRERPFGPSIDLMSLLETAGKESIILSDPDVKKDLYDTAFTMPAGGDPVVRKYSATLSVSLQKGSSGQS